MPNNSENKASEGARAMSKKGASRGGRARADKLTPQQRREIAQKAAMARWGTTALAATHDGELQIGDRIIKCAVLEDGTRLISQESFLVALDRAPKAKGGTGVQSSVVPAFLSAGNLQRYIPPDLRDIAQPVLYTLPGGGRSYGYKAEIVPAVCEVYLEARYDDVLTKPQLPAARAAEILIRGLARVGIIALIDEATGYQDSRARRELQRILEAYVQAELRPWVRLFPDEFFEQIYRLQGWDYKPGTSKRTPYVGKLINHYVYEQLPPGVLEQLQTQNPRKVNGHRAHKHHQFLTADTGHPQLDKQISTVTTLMRISDSKREFEDLFERAFPPAQARLPLVVRVDDGD
jgi:hypothetical protein